MYIFMTIVCFGLYCKEGLQLVVGLELVHARIIPLGRTGDSQT